MSNRFAAFFAAFNASVKVGNTLSRKEQIRAFTAGRTDSVKDLTLTELAEITKQLNILAGLKFVVTDEKADKMRKAIIAIFKNMNRTTGEAKAWAEKQGVNGFKKGFNDYSTGELFTLIRVAEKALSDYQQAIRKSISGL